MSNKYGKVIEKKIGKWVMIDKASGTAYNQE